MLVVKPQRRLRSFLPAAFLMIVTGFIVFCPIAVAAGDAGQEAEGLKNPEAAKDSAPAAGTAEQATEVSAAPARVVVAKVGEAEITEAELQDAVLQKVQSIYHGPDLARVPKYRREALNDLIEIGLLSHEAVRRGITVGEDVIDSVVQKNIKQLGSEAALQQVLQSRGLSIGDFRQGIQKRRAVNELLSKLYQESAYPDEELMKYYEENRQDFRRPDSVRLYSILLKVEPSAGEDEWQKKKEKAEGLLKRIKAGEKFYDIAYNNSEDPYRVKGGDLGFVHKGILTPTELEDAAFALKPDELSDVIRTIHGFHILKAGERMQGELLDFGKVKKDLAGKLQSRKFEEKKAEVLGRMRKEFPVKVMITLEDEKP